MIFLIIFFAAIGVWEMHVFFTHRYPEDVCISVGCFGAAAFLLAFVLHGGIGCLFL